MFFRYYYMMVMVHHYGDPVVTGVESVINQLRENIVAIQGYEQYTEVDRLMRLMSLKREEKVYVRREVNQEKEKQRLKAIK